MEYENKYASKSVAGAGLGIAIGAAALGLLNGGALPNVLGGAKNAACSEDHYINRYEAAQSARIAELETEVKLRDANTYTDGKILELYKYVDGRFGAVEGELCQQRVYNATNTAAINCINGQIAQLMSLVKIVIPNGSVCPGWGDATVSITPTTTTTAG